MSLELLGILSAVVFLIGDTPYFLNAARGKKQPHRVSWGVATLLNIVTFANQWASGADNSLWLVGAAILATGSIFLASLKNGVGGHTRYDIFAIIFSLSGVALWIMFDSPLFSILINLLVFSVSVVPTIQKSKNNPESETGIAFLFGSISALMAAISVGEWNFDLLVIPIYSALIQAYISYLLYIRPRRLNRPR